MDARAVSDPVTVRPMTADDLDAVCEIEQAVFAMPWSRQSFENEVSGDTRSMSFVAEEGGRVEGYLVAWHVVDELHIGNLAVRPDRQGEGLGARLVAAALAAAAGRGIRHAALEVRVSNARAIAVYERCGFRGVAIRRGYYEDNGEHALVMFREFGEAADGPGAEGVA
ncbi:MAG: ribosomal protein S18-alanine N-acetyltransferase [Candidatus Eisenbacteria bacterium]|nr:ribosomal protein S18-alanine N-acetyltransferase [Candidatus Eisenbacteria bacterium]